ncbi:hypothetical protein CRENPOLYSF2_910002 [Crenothrix polyspora]|uniref:Uncharacterized protein n=1 Tax=Crenothrix polyspora TaxID=360316 RepID=A0A1R4HJ37_9GAMM|nr:hypothetical protein CRENPOLYSF2_910002 [Crenothrix polyspora]
MQNMPHSNSYLCDNSPSVMVIDRYFLNFNIFLVLLILV